MAKTIMNGRFRSVCIEHIGPRFNVWRFDRDTAEYEVFHHNAHPISVTFSNDDALALALAIEQLKGDSISVEVFEDQLLEAIASVTDVRA